MRASVGLLSATFLDGGSDPRAQGQAQPVDDPVENLVGILRTQYLGSVTQRPTIVAGAKITGLLLRKIP